MSVGQRVCLILAVTLIAACASDTPASSAAGDVAADAEPEPTKEPTSTAAPAVVPAGEGSDMMTPEPAVEEDTMAPTPSPPAEPEPAPVTPESVGDSAATASESANLVDDVDAQSPPEVAAAETEEAVPPASCVRLTDFDSEAENFSWFIVNDNVMGGQSSGGPTFADSAMVFEGAINTDGGGFSSVRVSLGLNVLTDFTQLVVRARTDGRAYKLTLEDSLATRDRRVSQQGALDLAPVSEWQTATVRFADLSPRIFGRAVNSEAFRPELATQLGVMISDGVDGPFRLEIDWIDACP